MARLLGIAGIQMNVMPGEDNTRSMLAKLDTVRALAPWVDLIFFSELCACGLSKKQSGPIPNPALDRFCRWATDHAKWLIPGSWYEQSHDRLYNTAIAIAPDGTIEARYRKIFPWRPLEESAAGEEFCVFDIPGKGRIGLCICYDQWFPEVARSLAWMGAEAVICPTATSTPDRSREIVMARAAAIANQMYWLSLNGLGAGGIGQSVFFDPQGTLLQQGGEGERIMTEIIDLDLVDRTRKFGTAGECQVWKSFAGFRTRFPVYHQDGSQGAILKTLDPLQVYKKLDEEH